MTDKKWNKEEYDEVKKLQLTHQEYQYIFAYEMQKKLFDECSDPVQKARYERGLKILERNIG